MSERHHFMQILRLRNGDSVVLCLTFLLTVFTTLIMAVGMGILLAGILYIRRQGSLASALQAFRQQRSSQAAVQVEKPRTYRIR
ncbi:hypothetical protein [Paenibacillus medicaginis]|uniref:Uncharacterized protein n=1 Tax=Paenibacillus medicaginis TaxID=1470560 RepID=A0ABV5C2I0_9BACL